ncbi:MAG: DUF3107 domain-containing protein [Actinomycetaceae bacterium]|nr:DUF3107 domain-containing protein [Actinomycetaceae bacterium]
MKIMIGIQNVDRELEIDVPLDAKAIQSAVAAALSSNIPLTFTDSDGKTVIVPASSLGYVTTANADSRRVGFGFAG